MKIRIVCYEDIDKWILGKFALKLKEELSNLGLIVDIAKKASTEFDINHHVIYYDYNGEKNNIDTLMITHIDSTGKLKQLKQQLEVAALGICMSSDTMIKLSDWGIDASKLCYINPAHDKSIMPKKYVIGIASKVHQDARKREIYFEKLAYKIDPKLFEFKIMGEGWENYIKLFRDRGFKITYFNTFDYGVYLNFIPSLDYYLYTGMDEGQMGFLDAVAAGVDTIVTPQGFHLDAKAGITYSFETYDQLLKIFENLASQRLNKIKILENWGWREYAEKHLQVWDYLLRSKRNDNYCYPKKIYIDGIDSILNQNIPASERRGYIKIFKEKFNLLIGQFRIKFYSSEKLKRIKKIFNSSFTKTLF